MLVINIRQLNVVVTIPPSRSWRIVGRALVSGARIFVVILCGLLLFRFLILAVTCEVANDYVSDRPRADVMLEEGELLSALHNVTVAVN